MWISHKLLPEDRVSISISISVLKKFIDKTQYDQLNRDVRLTVHYRNLKRINNVKHIEAIALDNWNWQKIQLQTMFGKIKGPNPEAKTRFSDMQ